jgi:hypothetical protein
MNGFTFYVGTFDFSGALRKKSHRPIGKKVFASDYIGETTKRAESG